jgi:hypothetical protein
MGISKPMSKHIAGDQELNINRGTRDCKNRVSSDYVAAEEKNKHLHILQF